MAAAPIARPTIRLLPGRDARAGAGHPWVYSNEIVMDAAAKALPRGGLVNLVRSDGKPFGTGFFNAHCLIALRRLTPEPNAEIDADFIARRLSAARAWRDRLFDRPFYRLIHAEADGLPGFVIDRFGDVVVCQSNTAGSDSLAPQILGALDQVFGPRAVVWRDDSPMRGLEGIAIGEAGTVLKGALDGPVELEENGARFLADLRAGQKTGWFFDQRDNRAFTAALAHGARVLDAYCHTGGFAVQAALAGAADVVAIDRSKPALELARLAAERNGVAARCRFIVGEVFADLERRAQAGERYDVVIADPPAFARTKRDLPIGLKGYRKMAALAAALVAPGGFLALFSCSHHVEPAAFAEEVTRGMARAERTGRILRQTGAAPDHPVHPLLPESAYLKALVLQLD
ncbi:MAG: class I SAM-dependent rRNA methyltransferase [Alphaproteobacteria bacterium]|nr:class I SAM-dependent rRNA methyltransferase [Alphaproteobacteria bacterium]